MQGKHVDADRDGVTGSKSHDSTWVVIHHTQVARKGACVGKLRTDWLLIGDLHHEANGFILLCWSLTCDLLLGPAFLLHLRVIDLLLQLWFPLPPFITSVKEAM